MPDSAPVDTLAYNLVSEAWSLSGNKCTLERASRALTYASFRTGSTQSDFLNGSPYYVSFVLALTLVLVTSIKSNSKAVKVMTDAMKKLTTRVAEAILEGSGDKDMDKNEQHKELVQKLSYLTGPGAFYITSLAVLQPVLFATMKVNSPTFFMNSTRGHSETLRAVPIHGHSGAFRIIAVGSAPMTFTFDVKTASWILRDSQDKDKFRFSIPSDKSREVVQFSEKGGYSLSYTDYENRSTVTLGSITLRANLITEKGKPFCHLTVPANGDEKENDIFMLCCYVMWSTGNLSMDMTIILGLGLVAGGLLVSKRNNVSAFIQKVFLNPTPFNDCTLCDEDAKKQIELYNKYEDTSNDRETMYLRCYYENRRFTESGIYQGVGGIIHNVVPPVVAKNAAAIAAGAATAAAAAALGGGAVAAGAAGAAVAAVGGVAGLVAAAGAARDPHTP